MILKAGQMLSTRVRRFASNGLSLTKWHSQVKIAAMVARDARVLISAEQIRTRVKELAAEIEADYGAGPLYLISVLKGSFIFVADLARAFRHLPSADRIYGHFELR